MHGFVSRLLSSFDQVVLSFPITNDTVNASFLQILHNKFAVVIEEFPLGMIRNDSGAFVFNVASMYSDGNSINGDAINITTRKMTNSAATIVIPSSIAKYIMFSELRLTFALFVNEILFLRRSDEFTNLRVGSPIVSATVNNESITGLQEPVFITLRMDEVQL